MKGTFGKLMAMGFFAVGLMGCGKGDFTGSGNGNLGDQSSTGVVSETAEVVNPRISHTCTETADKCFRETFMVASNPTGKVDVLFVVQTSDSIAPQRAQIASEIQAFVQTLPPTADFNIAVMLSHGSTSSWSGRLYRAASEPIVLKSSELSNADIQSNLATKLTTVVTDPDSGGGEEGLFSLFHGITTPALLTESQGLGFFRADAALGVVFIGDRRDICAVVPAGVPAETDPVKIDARIRDCEGLTAAGLTSRLRTLKGTQDLQVSAITYADSPAPAGKELGYGYIDMVNLSPGVAIDIANDDISDGLASIAELAGQGSSIQTQFQLTHDNIDTSTVKVTVNGAAATFTIDGNIVTVTSTIPAGAVVKIDYCLCPNIQPPPCENDHHHGHHHNHNRCRPHQWWKNCWQWENGKWCKKWNHKHGNGDSGKHNKPCYN